MELHTELNKDWMGGEMARVASQLKRKNNNKGKKKTPTLPRLSPAPFTSNVALPLNQKKQSFEHCFKHTAVQDVSTKMCVQGC